MNDANESINNIVPFGKHKGKTVAEMLADHQYISWLNSQPWFAEKFTQIYNVVNQVMLGDGETPEHNALQARFLDPGFCQKVCSFDIEDKDHFEISPTFEVNGWDVSVESYGYKYGNHSAGKCWLPSFTKEEYLEDFRSTRWKFECNEIYSGEIGPTNKMCLVAKGKRFIEIKPIVGDDYPSILRQMKSNLVVRHEGQYNNQKSVSYIDPSICILYTTKIETKLVKPEDVIKIFNASGFGVFVDDSI